MQLTEKHLKLYEMIRERGQGRICNDLEPEEEARLTHDEWLEFAEQYSIWNGDHEEWLKDPTTVMMDFMVLGFVNHLLLENYRETLKSPDLDEL